MEVTAIRIVIEHCVRSRIENKLSRLDRNFHALLLLPFLIIHKPQLTKLPTHSPKRFPFETMIPQEPLLANRPNINNITAVEPTQLDAVLTLRVVLEGELDY